MIRLKCHGFIAAAMAVPVVSNDALDRKIRDLPVITAEQIRNMLRE